MILSRVRHSKDLRLLLKLGDRSTLRYVKDLEKDKDTADFFKAYVELRSGQYYWNRDVAIRNLRADRT